MREQLTEEPEGTDRLRNLLASVRRRWFATVALRAIGLGATAAALPALAAGAVYWILAPGEGALIALGAVALILSVAGVATIAHGIERRPDDRRVARFIEERAEAIPGARPMNDCVVSAVQALDVAPGDPKAPFASLVLAAARRCLEDVTPAAIVPPAAIRRAATWSAGGLALLILTLAFTAPALSHAWQTVRLTFFPGAVAVEVLPGDARVVAGKSLRIRARIHAGDEQLSRITPRLVVSSGSESQTVDMVRTDDGYEYAFESVDRSFEYVVAAGPAASARYHVTALYPPRVTRIDLHYTYPSFSGLLPRAEEDGGDIYAPAGTRVKLAIHVDKPLASAELTLSGGTAASTALGSGVVHADLVLSKDDAYRIRLRDRDGLRSDGDSEYFIRLMDDRPPDVRILRPAADQGITPLEEVPIEARAEDDYGVASLDLVFAVGGGKERVVPFSAVKGGSTERTGSYLLAAEDLAVRPGDVITYYARARDIGRGKPSRQASSDIFFLEVRPFNEEFVAAQSQAGAGGGGDPQIEALIDAQKEIISATWNIERRAAGGRSAEDIKAIAQAQADLKARVERLAAGGRGRGGFNFFPQQIGRPQPQQGRSGDLVASTLEAMTRAIEQLGSGRTRDAIPHETAALNALLQAQAEVRRRQVMQQTNSSGGGGWGNRRSQDLSALFDKELQRQQRTNYEQRSQVEEQSDRAQQDNDTLDRIRDLARRQEEIARQQREAAKLQAEERKRQLERLEREQQELQRAVEELSREMSGQQQSGQQQSGQQQSGQQQSGQQQSSQQQSGQQQSGQQQSGQQQAGQKPSGQQQAGRQSGQSRASSGNQGMRDAADQMRQAAGDLRRDDVESAARRGERAAEQLREIEQQMRGTGDDARQRASADLQAEAQQILQEQRRIAAEAERLEKGGEAAASDANRRLAADKDRLSDRVEALQREARRLGEQTGRGDESQRARAAAGQLEKDGTAQAMRDAAQQLRQGTPASAKSEQQIATSLEGVVDTLGGPGSESTRQLAEQLDASRQTREKLDALEAKLKEAQARGDADAGKLQAQYEQELRRTRDALGRQPSAGRDQTDALGGSTPETHEFSRSAPGTEAFKQDRTEWESLRRDVNRALEARDAAAARKFADVAAKDRMSAGGSERVPEQYRRLVAKYFEALGRARK